MVFLAVLTANTIAGEAENGTYQLLLSKPIRRWEPLLGKFIGVLIFGTVTIIAGLFVGAIAIYTQTGASPAALTNSIGTVLPGAILYAFLVTFLVTSVGTLMAVLTGSRLKTALTTAVIPVLFFAFVFVRLLPVGDLYDQYYLYLFDLNYHLGHLYVLIQGAVGPEFNPATKQSFGMVSGVYDIQTTWEDPLLEGISATIPLAGYVPPALSAGLILLTSIAVLAVAIFRFERMDISR